MAMLDHFMGIAVLIYPDISATVSYLAVVTGLDILINTGTIPCLIYLYYNMAWRRSNAPYK